MRISLAWAKTATQNVSLKWATASLSIVCLILVVGLLRLALKAPLVVDRGCYSATINPEGSTDPTREEIRAFLIEALSYRFDSTSEAKVREISQEESQFRLKEQDLLKQKQISQRFIVTKVNFEGKDIFIEADRILTIGKAKTILPMPLKVEVQKTTRSEANPYGLVLTGTSSSQKESEK
jgi:hypothetical protein